MKADIQSFFLHVPLFMSWPSCKLERILNLFKLSMLSAGNNTELLVDISKILILIFKPIVLYMNVEQCKSFVLPYYIAKVIK